MFVRAQLLATVVCFLYSSFLLSQTRMGSFEAFTPQLYPISGNVTLLDDQRVMFEDDFSTVQGITLEVFLSKTGDLDRSTDVLISDDPLGPGISMGQPITGGMSFDISTDSNSSEFDYVIVYCTSASMLWGKALMSSDGGSNPPNTQIGSYSSYYVGEGVKPNLTIDEQNNVHFAYMSERANGFIKHAVTSDTVFEEEVIMDGYFYGPLDIATDENGYVHVAAHDHGSEDLVYITNASGDFVNMSMESAGHDGWDSNVELYNGSPYFLSTEGVGRDMELFYLDDSGSVVEEKLGLDGIMYGFGVDFLIDGDQFYGAAYSRDEDVLYYVERVNGTWNTEAVKESAFFPNLDVDDSGTVRMAYLSDLEDGEGEIILATRDDEGSWTESIIATIDGIQLGRSGARNLINLIVRDQLAYILFSSDEQIVLARYDFSTHDMVLEDVYQPFENETLGQQVWMEIDDDDNIHVVTYTKGGPQSTEGNVYYITNKKFDNPVVPPPPANSTAVVRANITNAIGESVNNAEWKVTSDNEDVEVEEMADGSLQFTGPSDGEANIEVCIDPQDFDPSAKITALDVLGIQRHILGLTPLCENAELAADVNENGSVSGIDLLQISRVVLGLDSQFQSGAPLFRVFMNSHERSCVTLSFQDIIDETTELNIMILEKGNVTESCSR